MYNGGKNIIRFIYETIFFMNLKPSPFTFFKNCWQQNANNRPSSEILAKSLTQPDMYMLHNTFPPNDVDTLQKVRVCIRWTCSKYHVCSGYILVCITHSDITLL